jgi:Rrf2 family protein
VRVSATGRRALAVALDLALAEGRPVPAEEAARRRGIPAPALAKVLQRLVRAGVAVGHRGAGGGYRLARDPARVTVLEILSAFERPAGPRGVPSPDPAAPADPVEERLRALFEEVDETERCTLASVTLATLARAGAA